MSFRIELLDGPVVLAYDDNWQRQGNVIRFIGGGRAALEQGTGTCYRIWCGKGNYHFDQQISGPGVPRTTVGSIVDFSNFQITLDQRWMQILGLDKRAVNEASIPEDEKELKLW